MSGLGPGPKTGTITQVFLGSFHFTAKDGTVKGEPAGYYIKDAAGRPAFARRAAFPGGIYQRFLHAALDVAAPAGTPILARERGKVVKCGYDSQRGNFVFLEIRPGTIVIEQHMQKLLVTLGQIVARGQQLGPMGMTGFASGVHDHSALLHSATKTDWRYSWSWDWLPIKQYEVGGVHADAAFIKPVY